MENSSTPPNHQFEENDDQLQIDEFKEQITNACLYLEINEETFGEDGIYGDTSYLIEGDVDKIAETILYETEIGQAVRQLITWEVYGSLLGQCENICMVSKDEEEALDEIMSLIEDNAEIVDSIDDDGYEDLLSDKDIKEIDQEEIDAVIAEAEKFLEEN